MKCRAGFGTGCWRPRCVCRPSAGPPARIAIATAARKPPSEATTPSRSIPGPCRPAKFGPRGLSSASRASTARKKSRRLIILPVVPCPIFEGGWRRAPTRSTVDCTGRAKIFLNVGGPGVGHGVIDLVFVISSGGRSIRGVVAQLTPPGAPRPATVVDRVDFWKVGRRTTTDILLTVTATRRANKSSGFALLDEEVLALIQRAQPLPSPPPEVGSSRIELQVPVAFLASPLSLTRCPASRPLPGVGGCRKPAQKFRPRLRRRIEFPVRRHRVRGAAAAASGFRRARE